MSLSYRERYTIQTRYSYGPWPGSPDTRAHYREGTHYPPPEDALAQLCGLVLESLTHT